MKEGPERKNITRREALAVLAGASLSALTGTESVAQKTEYLPSILKQSELDAHKEAGATELVNGFWKYPRYRAHLLGKLLGGAKTKEEARENLSRRSGMFTVTPESVAEITARASVQLAELAAQTSPQKHSLFLDGDRQRLYLLKKEAGGLRFVKGYPTSTSRSGWNNASFSGGTPRGLHHIGWGKKGLLGEIIAAPENGAKDATQVTLRDTDKKPHKFVSSLVSLRDSVPDLITASYIVTSPETPPSRGIFIHGTNREDRIGSHDSGGCIRLLSVDMYDLAKYLEQGTVSKDGKTIMGGTPVMIHATQEIKGPPLPKKFETPRPAPSDGVDDTQIEPKPGTLRRMPKPFFPPE